MGLKKRETMDNSGLAFLIPLLLTLAVVGAIAIGGYAVYRLTLEPDVIYNITDTGFSLAGLELDSLWVIGLVLGALVVLWLLFRKPRRY